MKKFIYTGIAVSMLVLASCSKQDIQPNADEPTVPVWKSYSDGGTNPEPTGSDTDGGITDPNEDPEFSNTNN